MQPNDQNSDDAVPEPKHEEPVTGRNQGHDTELEQLRMAHAERLRQVEAERWRMGERIEALEARNAELQAGFLEQTRGLQHELQGLQQAFSEQQQQQLDLAVQTKADEAARLDLLREQLGSEVARHSARAEQLTVELLHSKDALIEQARLHGASSLEQQATAARNLLELRQELNAELATVRAQLERTTQLLSDAREELAEARHDRMRATETAGRTQVAAEAERERLQTLLADLAARHATLERDRDRERDRADQAERELDAASRDLKQGQERARALEQRLQASSDLPAASPANAEAGRLRKALTLMESEAQRQRRAVALLEAKADKTKDTLSFRLGYLLIHSPKSWRGMRRLPRALLELHQEAKRRRKTKQGDLSDAPVARGPKPTVAPAAAPSTRATPKSEAFADQALRLFVAEGTDAAVRFAEESATNPHDCASALTQLAKALRTTDPSIAKLLAQRAHSLEPLPFRAKWLAFLQYDAGEIEAPAKLLGELPADFALKPSERARMLEIFGLARLKRELPRVPERAQRAYEPVRDCCLYVAASSLPFHVSGYTVRTQQLLNALKATNWRVKPVLRPGYPADRGVQLEDGTALHQVDGISYTHLAGLHLRRVGLDEFVASAVEALISEARRVRPAVLHAASNHVNALPALIAARRLGIPFVYEVRGLWELTAASRHGAWDRTERFMLERALETLVAKQADRVLTLTEGLREELVSRGVAKENIGLLPNAVDADLFAPRRKSPEAMLRFGVNSGTFALVYAGSLLHYEGLDDLLRAVASVVQGGADVSVLIAGDGEALVELQRLTSELQLERRVKFLGRLAPNDIPELWSVADAAAFPRKPFQVCELVSPLKPLEPMAMAIPVIVSDVAALREMVRDEVTGLVHRAGDSDSLASKLRSLLADPALRQRLGRASRDAIIRERTWRASGQRLAATYDDLLLRDGIKPLELTPGRRSMTSEEKAEFEARLDAAHRHGGAAAVGELAREQAMGRGDRFLAFALLKAASSCQRNGDEQALELAREALEREDGPATLRGVARIVYAAGNFAEAAEIVTRLENAVGTLTGKDEELAREVRGRSRILALLAEPPSAAHTIADKVPGRSVYFLHFSLPYSSVGYATRSHGLIAGMQAAGWDVKAYTRCGFPYDFKPELDGQAIPDVDSVDGVDYHRLLEGGRRGSTESEYLLTCADSYERVLRRERPEIVHAASNYVTALPALIAARRLGLPFIYEIRGFWEITRSSRDNEFENSARYALMRHFEGVVARAADQVYTLTSAMRDELIRRGVDAAKISLIHNGVDPTRFVPLAPDARRAELLGLTPGTPVIGYVGSFVDYEGLDDLIHACSSMAERGVRFRLLLVGDGAESNRLRDLAARAGLTDTVLFTGRVPHEEVESYYSLIDICPFPRKPWEVCEMVSPLKPFEAMAMRKVVVVSSTHALREIVDHERTGLVFQKGDPDALAEALTRLVDDPALRDSLAENGRAWAVEHRSWGASGRVAVNGYRALLEDRGSHAGARIPA